MKCETVKVVRKDHPDGYTEINKSDMTKDDVVYGKKAPTKAAPKKDEKKSKK